MTILEPEFVDIETSSGPMRCHLFQPAGEGRYPGIVMYSEIYQVTGPIKRTAAMLAGQGYIVSVPEIYHEFESPGVAFNYDPPGTDRGNTLKTTKELAHYDADARASLDMLKNHQTCSGQLGVLGICIGGHLAFRAAMNQDVEAGVCFYATDIHKRSLGKNMNDDTLDRMNQIKGEMLMIWGRHDPHIPADGRRIIYDAMSEANINFTWHEFNGQHAFMRDEGHRYDSAIAHVALGMVYELFGRRLNHRPI